MDLEYIYIYTRTWTVMEEALHGPLKLTTALIKKVLDGTFRREVADAALQTSAHALKKAWESSVLPSPMAP